ncbi:MAG: MFS transporter [Caldilineales bacterium]|nr:MFS transporter [Caldilineales bacterium]MCW5857133.1 MFS transporter [Caldilineales bacterium]
MQTASVMTRASRSLQRTFVSLHSPNYRLWFIGQLVSLVGTWMQATAQGYLMFELTKSPAFLGYVGFASGLPSWLFTLYGGVIADRMSRRTLMVITQSAMMVLAFLLAGLVFTGRILPWHIIAIALALGVANAFDAPARQAFVVELVDRDDLTNAIALNATMFNAAVVVGPAIAAAVYALLGPAWCFTINGLSFIAVIVALLLMKLAPQASQPKRSSALSQLKEGLRYTSAHPTIRAIILNLGMISLFGVSILTLLPAWSVDILGGDVKTNGLLLSARGIGSLTGALLIAWLGQRQPRGRMWTIGSLMMPVVLAVFAIARWLPLSMVAMMGLGWAFMVQANISNSLVQTAVPDALRGRVMGIYTLVFFGAMPLGSLLAGGGAHWLGESGIVLFCAVVLALTAALIWLRLPSMRKLT